MPNARSRTIWRIGPDDSGDCSGIRQRSTPFRFAARSPRTANDPIPYSKEALRQDLARVRNAWEECQAARDRNAIYGYLSAVFDLVMWWKAEDRAVSRARWALQLQRLDLPTTDEPFAAIILCTADRRKVDKRTRSKWSRVMRYAARYKPNAEPLDQFIRRRGGDGGRLCASSSD
jgi:hypothetical protein